MYFVQQVQVCNLNLPGLQNVCIAKFNSIGMYFSVKLDVLNKLG